jgi:LemA protein
VIIILVVVALLVVVGIAYVVLYNSLSRLVVSVDAAWSQVQVQLKRRSDLIGNLVETVKGYAGHERETLQAVTDARAAVSSASGPAEAAAGSNLLTQAVGRLFAVAEAYPDLKASANFSQLQSELTGTEDRIAYARQYYNQAVKSLNTRRVTFPGNLVAGSKPKFAAREFFEAPEGETQAPQVSFD